MRTYAMLIALLSVVALAGCGSGRRFRYTQVAKLRQMTRAGVTYDEAFDVATGVLADQFGSIEKRNRRTGEIHCNPTVYIPSRLTYRSFRSPLAAGQARYQRQASIKLQARDGVVMAGIRVEIQREDTREHRQFARLRDPYDTEMDTPLDDGAEGGIQDRVWTFVRFDDIAERDALADLRDRLVQLTSLPIAPTPGQPATQPAGDDGSQSLLDSISD